MKLNPDKPVRRLHCNVCGQPLGWSQTKSKISLWCSQECSETPISPNEVRDELFCVLFLQGKTTWELAKQFHSTHQNVQQILLRRGFDLDRNRGTTPESTNSAVSLKGGKS
jgi:hypothetical protein